MTRESIIECVTEVSGEDVIISTTGKASRELFEIRERRAQGHGRDFLTAGSMGHSSSIALGIALAKPGESMVHRRGRGGPDAYRHDGRDRGKSGPGQACHHKGKNKRSFMEYIKEVQK